MNILAYIHMLGVCRGRNIGGLKNEVRGTGKLGWGVGEERWSSKIKDKLDSFF